VDERNVSRAIHILALGNGRHSGNSALVVLVSGHPDVTGLTPVSSPRILDNPISNSGTGGVPANHQNTVVKLGARTLRLVVHTAGIELERAVACVNGHTDGSANAGSLQGGFRTGLDVGIGAHGGADVGLVESASSVASSVGIRGLGVDSLVGNDVVERVSHQTSIAAFVSVAGGTIDQVLFGEGDKAAGLDLVASFNSSGGGERPARSALALVLNSGDGTLGNPVHGGGGIGVGTDDGRRVSNVGDVHVKSQIGLCELSRSQITQRIHSKSEGLLGVGVVGLNDGKISSPNIETVTYFNAAVAFGVFSGPFVKFRMIVTGGEHNGKQ